MKSSVLRMMDAVLKQLENISNFLGTENLSSFPCLRLVQHTIKKSNTSLSFFLSINSFKNYKCFFQKTVYLKYRSGCYLLRCLCVIPNEIGIYVINYKICFFS